MKIEELISGKGDGETIPIGKISLPVSALKKFKPYKTEKTFSLWGKTSTGCFTEQEILERS